MSKTRTKPDRNLVQLTLPLSELPSRKHRTGSLRTKEAVKEELRVALRRCGLSHEAVADELSRLVGEPVSHFQIDNWVAPNKDDRAMPLEYAAALAVITNCTSFLQVALEAAGILVLNHQQAPYYELGRITAEGRARSRKLKAVLERIPEI